MIGIGATLFKRMAGGSRFSIASLFSSGEQGLWYDPSDISTMFQEDTSAVPAVIGQPVGTILDKSQSLKLGSELITNGSFDTDSNWSKADGWSIANGVAVADNISGKNLTQGNLGLTTNAVYEVTFTVVTRSSGSVIVRLGGSTPVSSSSYNAAGTYTAILRANASNTTIAVRGQGGFTGTVDNVSLKEIQGKHARQITSDKRPVLARHPEGGIRNLLDYTQEFDDSYWTKSGSSVTADQEVAPDGTTTAELYQQPSNSASHYLRKNGSAPPTTVTGSVYVKRGNCDFVFFSIGGSTCIKSYVNLSTGALVDSGDEGSGTLTNATVTDVGNGWYRLTISGTFNPAQTPSNNIGISLRTSGGMPLSLDTAFTGNSENAYVWGAQVEVGSTATQYQHVTDDLRYDITEPFGANSLNYLAFDNSNDCLQVVNLDMSASDELTAHSGHRKIGTSNSILYEHSGNSGTGANTGTFKLNAPHSSNDYIFGAGGDVNQTVAVNGTDYASPVTLVSTHTVDISADSQVVRLNGVQVSASSGNMGTGNFTDRIFNIGSRNNGFGLPFSGNLYGLIVRGKVSTDKEIESTESYLAKKTGVLAETVGLATLSLDFGGGYYTARNRNGGVL